MPKVVRCEDCGDNVCAIKMLLMGGSREAVKKFIGEYSKENGVRIASYEMLPENCRNNPNCAAKETLNSILSVRPHTSDEDILIALRGLQKQKII